MTGIAFAGIIGGPLSRWIMTAFDGYHGLNGWQWMFLLEALPSLTLGIAVLVWLDNSVASAKWLSPDEKALIEKDLAKDGCWLWDGPPFRENIEYDVSSLKEEEPDHDDFYTWHRYREEQLQRCRS